MPAQIITDRKTTRATFQRHLRNAFGTPQGQTAGMGTIMAPSLALWRNATLRTLAGWTRYRARPDTARTRDLTRPCPAPLSDWRHARLDELSGIWIPSREADERTKVAGFGVLQLLIKIAHTQATNDSPVDVRCCNVTVD